MRPARPQERGVSLIESMIALTLLAFGLTGVLAMQLISVRTNTMARRLQLATAMARDLAESASLWEYDDPRLATTDVVTSLADSRIAAKSDLGRERIVPSTRRAHFAEQASPNAVVARALRRGGKRWDGLEPDGDGTERAEVERYWSVFKVDPDADGVENGKLVVILVRWHEAPLGFRQIAITTFRSNAGAFSQ